MSHRAGSAGLGQVPGQLGGGRDDKAAQLALTVEPSEYYESWQINSSDGLLITCVPGGELAISHTRARASPQP